MEESSAGIRATQARRQFLVAATGTALSDDEPLSDPQNSWLLYIERQIKKYPATELGDLLQYDEGPSASIESNDLSVTKIFLLLASLADFIKRGHHPSIDNALGFLTNQHLIPGALEQPLKNRARTLVFHLMAIITMMYSTELEGLNRRDVDELRIDQTQCISIEFNQPAEIAELPFCEMMQSFGPLLPVKDDTVMQSVADPVFSADSLYVSLLNASTLTQVGEIQIQWINNISSHLQFDSESRTLKLFCLPSFAEVNSNTSAAVFKYETLQLPLNAISHCLKLTASADSFKITTTCIIAQRILHQKPF
ncbi:hypothetical protein NW762_010223 [Fusarium torreyae]|uniref:Uncharacterized protein n=1 Tax=Fusarium torreyae TaxID=1237075 RepID=A0A9W8VDN7_9HYPO|nr:hypothetical protein NW762_010223 [Fusarium torreyae]